MKKNSLFIVLVIFSLVLISVFYYHSHPLEPTATINGHRFILELSVTPEEKQKGLGYRNNLREDHGMLFLYDHKELYGFWMKGMRFPLDYLWIDGTRIVDMTENVPAPVGNEEPVTLQPKIAVDRVLEINAGLIRSLGFKIGDTILFSR